jgi:DNA-binding NtrC family response regulator
MPDLDLLFLRASGADDVRHAARATQRALSVHAGRGADLERIARELHAQSARSNAALVVLNGAQLDLEEIARHAFEAARHGTLAVLGAERASPAAQSRLAARLRAWRSQSSGAPHAVLLFEAPPRDLRERGLLSNELYEALDGHSLRVPPLAERREDISTRVRGLLAARGHDPARVTASALEVLERLPWNGGERELALWLERALLLAGDGPLEREHVEPPSLERAQGGGRDDVLPLGDRSLAAVEAALIQRVLAECAGNISRCAAVLGIHRSTLHDKLRALRLD